MLKLSYLFCGILKRYNGTECKLSFKISLKLKSCIYKLSSMRLFLILCSYAKILTSSKEIVQVGLQARCFPTSVILVPLVFICSSNRVFIHRPVSPIYTLPQLHSILYTTPLWRCLGWKSLNLNLLSNRIKPCEKIKPTLPHLIYSSMT